MTAGRWSVKESKEEDKDTDYELFKPDATRGLFLIVSFSCSHTVGFILNAVTCDGGGNCSLVK